MIIEVILGIIEKIRTGNTTVKVPLVLFPMFFTVRTYTTHFRKKLKRTLNLELS